MVQIQGRIEVGLRLIVTDRASEQLAPFDRDAFPAQVREPLAPGAATRAILRGSMRVHLCGNNPERIRFLSSTLIDFAPELVRLFAVHPARLTPP